MKKNTIIFSIFALTLTMLSCGGKEETEDKKAPEEEMSVDEKELEEEFEKLDEDVENLETLKTVL